MSSGSDTNGEQSKQTEPDSQSSSMREALDRLSRSASGIDFIYAALEVFAERFTLLDAVIVLPVANSGTRIFRLGGEAASSNFAAQAGLDPGMYCKPRVDAPEDLEILWGACSRALTHSLDPVTEAEQPARRFKNRLLGAKDDRGPLAARAALSPRDGRKATARRDQLTLAFSPSLAPREIVSLLLVVVDLVTFAMTIANTHGPVRFVLGLILGLLIPGWSVVGLIRLRNAALEVGLSMAASLAMLTITAQVLMALNLWHPIALEEVLCVLCLPSLLWQSGWRVRRVGSPS